MKFELISFGSDTLEIRNRVIGSYIIHELFKHKQLTLNIIKERVKEKFNVEEDENYCRRQLEKHRQKDRVKYSKSTQFYSLTGGEILKLQRIKDDIEFEENFLIFELHKILKEYELEKYVKEFVSAIAGFYKNQYNKDISEINEYNLGFDFEHDAIRNFQSFINDMLPENGNENTNLFNQIISLCDKINFLKRVSAGDLIAECVNSLEFPSYTQRQDKTVYLDTPVLLYLFCALYSSDSNFDNIYYRACVDLLNYNKNGEIKLRLFVSSNYLRETAFLLINAIKVAPFSDNEYYRKLGKTSNPYFMFYKYLKDYGELESHIHNFSDFLGDMGFNRAFSIVEDRKAIDFVNSKLKHILNTNGFEVFDLHDYKNDRDFKFKYIEIREYLTSVYIKKRISRSESAIKNDALMLCELYDSDVEKTDPTFITWDNTFFEFRKQYHQNHPDANYWHLFRPSKYLDHLSIINFEIRENALSQDVYSIIESDFDIQGRLKTLKDVLSRIIDLKTASGTKLTNEIVEIREKYIFEIHKEVTEKQFEASQPIDELIVDLSNYYLEETGKYNLSQFSSVLNTEIMFDKIIVYFTDEVEFYKVNGRRNTERFCKMDSIISSFLINE